MVWYAAYEISQDILYIIEVLVFVLATKIYLQNRRDKLLFIIWLILLLTFLVESFGVLIHALHNRQILENPNILGVYNAYSTVVLFLWFYFFWCIVSSKFQRLIVIFSIIYGLSVILEWLLIHDLIYNNNDFSFVIGSILIIITIAFYFGQILKDGSYSLLKNNMYFLISCGLLLYHVVNIPFSVVRNLFSWNPTTYAFFVVTIIFACFMYIFIGIGLYQYERRVNAED